MNIILSNIHTYLRRGLDLKEIDQSLSHGEWPQMIYDLTGSQKAAFVAQLLQKSRPGLILTYSEEQAQKWANDLRTWCPHQTILHLPTTEWLPFEILGRSRETTSERIRVLSELALNPECTVVASVLAVERRLFPAERWKEFTLTFEAGHRYNLSEVLSSLTTSGYERIETVEGHGQFALRGGILDIAPLDGEAVRIEFFDDEVDSIRTFDLGTQKSIRSQNKVSISPAMEYIVTKEELGELRFAIRAEARKTIGRLQRSGRNEAAEHLQNKVDFIVERLEQGILDENIYPFLSLINIPLVPFFSYLSKERYVILDEPLRLKEQLEFEANERLLDFTQQLERGEGFVHPESQFIAYEELSKQEGRNPLIGLSTLLRQAPGLSPKRIFNLHARPLTGFMGKTSKLVDEIVHRKDAGNVVALFVGDEEHALRLIQGLKDRGVTATRKDLKDSIEEGHVYVYPFSIDHGFELPLGKLVVLTETEIYKRESKAVVKKTSTPAPKNVFISDLKQGDFVVHVHHGIGQFTGIERLEVGGIAKDYFGIRYAGEDRLYVPLDQLHLLQKYLGSAGETLPKLYKLGGSEWHKVKRKTRSAVKEMAIDLVKLYAQREAIKGYAFSQDNVWQNEFEEKFPYVETPDQLQSIADVKADMMRSRPMDRLLCGDVGYGKTEVALRAAFKAVMDSKQVAVLVPTTILAQQHFNTFKERFIGYPITIEMMSRFRSQKEQKEIIKGLKEGRIDVIVGTHRILSEAVKFHDLGLLVIDEEQRFGVAHKEKLKTLKGNVDVLTLSATPIPRTLHMSLVGVRDMSVIETPPEGRYPVQTYVTEFRADVVREAIRREIQRGGQVFYVHNRVEDMDQVTNFLSQLVPEAKFGVAHGQMRERELERVMLDFLEHEMDVLISTTIIETGLDMPNANTLIIDEADRFGLSQLYQLRGRVGRSNRKAFTYLLYKPQKVLTEIAEKRLAAIREFTEFGAGFKIAMRDLEIRGAGNLIGAQQHGHLAAVGFEMYSQMLKEAVQELRGEKVEEVVEPSIELQIDAFLADSYVADSQTKATLYQRLAMVRNEEQLSEMVDELVDRFGTPPREVEHLIEIIRLKLLASSLKIEQIQQLKQNVSIRFLADTDFITGEKLMSLASACPYPLAFKTMQNGNLECKIRIRTLGQEAVIEAVRRVLSTFCDIASRPTP
ncbi:transcription-repair coupling factor [Desulfosporosinus sp.]|uniref:transcription-repair coupling factor n=1 Tax=Desulfosporosinus sp. TaxID=157907 RepID=UPI0025B8490B|nr:transcription-repair coupling factor [Desulfosporosinus sp.]MBC2722709.1 transcription-repair coupling factor [Desulfosporosinus sp.]MBC2727831.1 transcription-repair coupling factor [Desulfosporosinus sp.]